MNEAYVNLRIDPAEALSLVATPQESSQPRDLASLPEAVTIDLGRIGMLSGYREDIVPRAYGEGHSLSGTLLSPTGETQAVQALFYRRTLASRILGRGVYVHVEKVPLVPNHQHDQARTSR